MRLSNLRLTGKRRIQRSLAEPTKKTGVKAFFASLADIRGGVKSRIGPAFGQVRFVTRRRDPIPLTLPQIVWCIDVNSIPIRQYRHPANDARHRKLTENQHGQKENHVENSGLQ